MNGQSRNLRLIALVLGKTLLWIVQERFYNVVIFHVGTFGQNGYSKLVNIAFGITQELRVKKSILFGLKI